MDINKGDCFLVGREWYVVVKPLGDDFYGCICDHANNAHAWKKEDARLIVSAKEILWASGWSSDNEELVSALRERKCPDAVIAAVLAGCHEDRFN